MLVELLMRCTTYILSWLGWMLPELLGDSLLLTLLGNGLLLDVGLRACRITCALHYVYSKAGWVVGCGY